MRDRLRESNGTGKRIYTLKKKGLGEQYLNSLKENGRKRAHQDETNTQPAPTEDASDKKGNKYNSEWEKHFPWLIHGVRHNCYFVCTDQTQ